MAAAPSLLGTATTRDQALGRANAESAECWTWEADKGQCQRQTDPGSTVRNQRQSGSFIVHSRPSEDLTWHRSLLVCVS